VGAVAIDDRAMTSERCIAIIFYEKRLRCAGNAMLESQQLGASAGMIARLCLEKRSPIID